MIKVVNTGLIDWFNEFYGERYCSLIIPQRGYYLFNSNESKAIMQIHFCPFCSKRLDSL
jgi:hypothetical protein